MAREQQQEVAQNFRILFASKGSRSPGRVQDHRVWRCYAGMTTGRMTVTFVRALVLSLLVAGGLSQPARAQGPAPDLRADFNADGILDTAVIQKTPTAAHIEVWLSGRDHPFYLLAPESLDALRSADLTGDGRTDLVAHSASGVLVWINTGTQFLPVPVTDVLSRGAVPLAGSSPDNETQTPAASDSDSDHTPSDLSPALYLTPGGVARLCTCTLDFAVPRRPVTASATRAPPASAR
jgi:hypothetical protein